MKKKIHNTHDFTSIGIKLASPEIIRDWSYGEVTKPETINYRTQRSEKSGLFDEKIFGPEKDYECFCGKYKGIRYKGIVCDRCGVEITRSIVRRERMGHIELATPVSHIWFLRGIPSRIALILGVSATEVERVVYFAGYIVTKIVKEEKERILKEIDTEYKIRLKSATDDKAKKALKELLTKAKSEIGNLEEGDILDEASYHKYSVKYGTAFEAGIGAEAIYNIFKKLDLKKLLKKLEERKEKAGVVETAKLIKRIALVKSMISANIRPEWVFLTVIPVGPPALRPMVALEGGRHATSDVNDLYRRVINRNNRLKKLIDINAPEVILRNEKRILQEAVDALIDNSIRHGNSMMSAMSQSQRRPLKSLSDYLKGKQGYFRQNLLGKRVDYSGRSVIVVGPELSLDQCGLPKHMALELFRPFVISKLLEREIAYNIRGAGRLIEEGMQEVWAILEEVIEGKYVLLNRAPTLHRQGIQAFRPVLIEGNAIQIHPLVCPAFNADFDGDQMAVHVPLSEEAQLEAKEIMSANKNILKPGNGEPVIAMAQDIVLGCYWMTKTVEGEKGEGNYFQSPNAAILAYDYREVDFRAKIHVMATNTDKYQEFEEKLFETTVGRLLFNSVLPSDYPFINGEMTKKALVELVDNLIEKYGLDQIPTIVDKIKTFGFKYATKSGITWSMDDLKIPARKGKIIESAKKKQNDIYAQYNDGLLSKEEKKRMNIEIWHNAKDEVSKLMPEVFAHSESVNDIVTSGSRGSVGQLTMMVGMKGLIQNTQGETLEFPILTSYQEGLPPIEYFVTTHGARKGLADTALQTAKAGYLTRKLFDVAQNAIITEKDCSTKGDIVISRKSSSGIEIQFTKAAFGRVLSKNLVDTKGKVVFKRNRLISAVDARDIENMDIETIHVRSPMTCATQYGVCQNCYGADPTTHQIVDMGEAVGTIAAQAIGEPGTQLSMNTKHAGGAASVGGDIVQGLPRVEEVFERRIPKSAALVSRIDGLVSEIREEEKERIIILTPGADQPKTKRSVEYVVPLRRMILVKVGDEVKSGTLLTDGSVDISDLYKYAGKEEAQEYIIRETSKIYELQGVTISRKHIEIIVKQMFGRIKISDGGDTVLNAGEVVEGWQFIEENKKAKEEGILPAVGKVIVLGITESSLTRKSFLSAASFQNTTKILINAAVRGATDTLKGLKENVIIGRLIPAGTGFAGSKKHAMIHELQEEIREKEERLLAEQEGEE